MTVTMFSMPILCSFTEIWSDDMTFYERAIRYIWRKKSKSILLLLCFLMIGTMVLCATMILQTAQETSCSIQEKNGNKACFRKSTG